MNGSLDYARRIKSRKLFQNRPENLWKQLPYKSISTLAKDRALNLPENQYGRMCCYLIEPSVFGSVRHLSSTGYNGFSSSNNYRRNRNQPFNGDSNNGTFVSSYYEVSDSDIVNALKRKNINSKTTGDHIVACNCPFCSPTKGKIDNLWKLYIKRGDGAYFCHRCGAKGSWFDFKSK